MDVDVQPWRDAWQAALYGENGFYRREEGPAGHFATSAQGIDGVDDILAQAIWAFAEDAGADIIVDFAAGRGELATALHRLGLQRDQTGNAQPPQTSIDPSTQPTTSSNTPTSSSISSTRSSRTTVALAAIDIVDRPTDLPAEIAWVQSPGGSRVPPLDFLAGRRALVVAHEWLDVVPCTIAELDDDATWREVETNSKGEETLGAPLDSADHDWLNSLSPPPEQAPGIRVEIGRTRDEAWSALTAEVASHAAAGSVMLGIDYSITTQTLPPFGTLTGFHHGAECAAVPDGSCDLTSHVMLDTLAVDQVTTGREYLLATFGERALASVPIDLATKAPAEYLDRLRLRSAFSVATARGGLGDFAWFWTTT